MQKLDSHSEIPLYRQLYNELKQAIDSGFYKSGEQIPSEDRLREMYGISRITVRKALEELTADKILVKRHGKGTFVAKTEYVEVIGAKGSFTKCCLMMNAVPTTQILSAGLTEGCGEAQKQLGLGPDEKMVMLRRLRCVDGVPVIVENDYFPKSYQFLLDLDLRDCSLHQVLWEQAGIRVCRLQDVIDLCSSDEEQAQLLNCKAGHQLLRVCGKFYGTDPNILYYNEQFILSERYKYVMESTF